ncbi:hypothetical protein MHYP_G00069590 [Metynnis hypsauchen]
MGHWRFRDGQSVSAFRANTLPGYFRFISSYETVKNLLHDGRHDIIQRANPPVSQKHEESGESAVAAQDSSLTQSHSATCCRSAT